MDQIKIGMFLKELRKERNLTQEEEAEIFSVNRRTVTRWETGYNMPDLSILVDIADFYDVDLREIFEGERKNTDMNTEEKETMKKVAEYNNLDKKRTARTVIAYAVIGIVALIINQAAMLLDIKGTFWAGFIKGSTAGLTLCSMIMTLLFASGKLVKIQEVKKNIAK